MGNLNLAHGSQIDINSVEQAKAGQHNQFTVNGNLSGQGLFNYTTNVAKDIGDQVIVNGSAVGEFKLNVQDVGTSPDKHNNNLTLFTVNGNTAEQFDALKVDLANPEQTVDLGTYRYGLVKDNTQYRLFSLNASQEVLQEIADKLAAEEAEKARLAAIAAEEVEKARLAAEQAEQAQKDAEAEQARLARERAAVLAEQERLAKLTQADVISQRSNAALSELSSQADTLANIQRGIVSQFNSDDAKGIWLSVNRSDTQHHSDLYRPYDKLETLSQLGLSHQIDNSHGQLTTSLIYSRAESRQKMDGGISNQNTTDAVSGYIKQQFNQGSYVVADASYGLSKSELLSAGQSIPLKRNMASFGLSVGHKVTTPLLDVKASLGIRDDYLGAVDYDLSDAKINIADKHLPNYRVGINLEKAINTANGVKITPSVGAEHVAYFADKTIVNVNGDSLEQRFSDHQTYSAGVEVEHNRFALELKGSQRIGEESTKQNAVGLKLKYLW
ncbi:MULTISPECIES: autotransporter outer membrane beta-barrel domain-containing protein [unclassified Acinetobacter]|uniref:autotransporter outer membrane beta-barrel domain-containing protein n=1 Tax=unclassified Acinetobacter TaxID=196816 RepID=UPI0035B72987